MPVKAIAAEAADSAAVSGTALQRDLNLPLHFGRNLDALWDALTVDATGPIEIEWHDHAWARAKLGADYGPIWGRSVLGMEL